MKSLFYKDYNLVGKNKIICELEYLRDISKFLTVSAKLLNSGMKIEKIIKAGADPGFTVACRGGASFRQGLGPNPPPPLDPEHSPCGVPFSRDFGVFKRLL